MHRISRKPADLLLALALALVLAALLGALPLLVYQGIEQNGFHFDDWHSILLNPAVQMEHFSLGGLLEAARGASLPHRPFPSITFAVDWWRGGDQAATYLATNLLIHVLATWAVFVLCKDLSRRAYPAAPALATTLAAAAAAAWWSVQPIHVQAVSYIVQRMTELAALFTVLGVWTYALGRTDRRHRWQWWPLSVGLLLLGALSKPNAWIAPALVLMTEFLVVRNGTALRQTKWDAWLIAAPLVAAVAGTAALAVDGPFSRWILANYAWRDFTLTERLLTQPKVLLFHVSQLLWPHPARFSLEHELAVVRSIASWHFWLPFLVILAWCGAGVWLAARKNRRIAGFFVLWIPVTLLIESTVVPLEMIFEHRMYLPTAGFAGLLALGLLAAHRRSPALAVAAGGALAAATAFGGWATHERLPQWRTPITLLENSVRHAPNSVRSWNQLGVEYLEQGQLDQAARAIDRANRIEPRWGDGYPFVNRGVLLEAQGKHDQARQVYNETIRLFPRQVLGYNNRGLLSLRDGDVGEAARYFDRAIAVDPAFAAAWTNRGTVRYLQGNIAAAQQDFEHALSLSPREAIAFHYLGRIHAAAGRLAEARRAQAQACRLGIARDCSR